VKPVITYLLVGIPVGLFCLRLSPVEMTSILEAVRANMESDFTLGEVWRMLAPLLGNQDVLPLVISMYSLITIGPGLEKRYGGWRYLALYLVAGYAGNVLAATAAGSRLGATPPGAPLPGEPLPGALPAVIGLIGGQMIFALHHTPIFGKRATAVVYSSIRLFLLNLAAVVLPLGPALGGPVDGLLSVGRVWSILGGLAAGAAFARFGGPTWEVVGFVPHLRVVDSRSRLHSLFIALILVGLAFLYAQVALMGR
jgi:rhomboid protease GluP